MANGFMPSTKALAERNSAGGLNFALAPGATIRGRVQTVAGKPLPRVRVSRERASILRDDGIVWSGLTDVEGRFEWNGSPNEPQTFYFGLAGYAQVRDIKLAPSEAEQVITLKKVRTLRGTVRDAIADQNIPVFLVMPATGSPERLSSWSSSSEREFKNGAFELALDEQEYNVLRIRAEGYLTDLIVIPPGDGEAVDARLRPSKTLEGVVIDASGNPVPRAEIAAPANGERASVALGKGRFVANRTDADKNRRRGR